MRDRATLYITQLQEADGQPVPQPPPWTVSSKNLEAALQAYLSEGATSAPFDLVQLLTWGAWRDRLWFGGYYTQPPDVGAPTKPAQTLCGVAKLRWAGL